MAALLVLSVLLVGVPSMTRRRAELAAWHAAGRGEDAPAAGEVPARGAGRGARAAGPGARGGGRGSQVVPVRGSAVAASSGERADGVEPLDGAVALRPVGTGLRRAAPGPRVLVRRSSLPRPRCAPGASSRPVLAGRPVGAPAGQAPGGVVRATVRITAPVPGPPPATGPVGSSPGAPLPGDARVVRGEVVPPPRTAAAGPGAAGPGAAAPASAGPDAPLRATAPAPRGTSTAVVRPDRARTRRRSALHLARLAALALAGAAVGVLAVLGVLPAAAAAVLPGLLALDVVLLRRRAVRCRAAQRTARVLGAPAAAGATAEPVGPLAAAERPVLLEWEDEPAPPRGSGVVEGLLTPLADLRAAAAADAADGLRGPTGPASEQEQVQVQAPDQAPSADVEAAGTAPSGSTSPAGARRRTA